MYSMIQEAFVDEAAFRTTTNKWRKQFKDGQ